MVADCGDSRALRYLLTPGRHEIPHWRCSRYQWSRRRVDRRAGDDDDRKQRAARAGQSPACRAGTRRCHRCATDDPAAPDLPCAPRSPAVSIHQEPCRPAARRPGTQLAASVCARAVLRDLRFGTLQLAKSCGPQRSAHVGSETPPIHRLSLGAAARLRLVPGGRAAEPVGAGQPDDRRVGSPRRAVRPRTRLALANGLDSCGRGRHEESRG